MQIYKGFDIGSAKPTKEEMQGIKHYMLDFVEPNERYSVAEYKKQAITCINEILAKGKVPIVVGGTGLYINSLIYGIDYLDIQFDEEYRKELEKRAEVEGLDVLYNEAKKIDPEAMEKISINDRKRIIRVLEIYKETNKTKSEIDEASKKNGVPFDYKLFIINMDRELLYERINKRVDIMVEQGLIEEVSGILKKYSDCPTAMQALGYKETKEYIDGEITKDEMIEKIKMESRRYAKRQLTWFRKNKEAFWLENREGAKDKIIDEILKLSA